MSKNIARLSAWVVVASAGFHVGNVSAEDAGTHAARPAPPVSVDAPSPDHMLGAAPHPMPPPLQPIPLVPDPVKLGGFRPKADPAPGTFLQEGSFVFERPARFVVDADGKAVLRFSPDAKSKDVPVEDVQPGDSKARTAGSAETKPAETKPADPKPAAPKVPPVYVLPNLKRMAIEDALKGRSLPLIVTGTVTEFDGRNFLLLDDSTRPAGPPATSPVPATAPATRPSTPARNMSADQLMGQLLRAAPGTASGGPAAAPAPDPLRWDKPAETDKNSGSGAITPGAPALTLKREGHYLADRLGRLSRGADGKATEFVIEADGRALRDPPLVVMPCTKLYIMQATVAAVGHDARFRVSGTVTEYRGRNYLLPEKVVLMPDVVQSF